MLNQPNEEDLLKVEQMFVQACPIAFKTANEIFDVRINEYNGPELYLSDGSKIIFSSYSQYYKIISNRNDEKIYDVTTKSFNLKKMNDLYLSMSDDCVDVVYENDNVYRVDLYYIMDAPIYRFSK